MSKQMIKTGRKQRGLSPILILVILIIASFFGMIIAKLAPPYYDNVLVQDALRSLAEDNVSIEKNEPWSNSQKTSQVL